MQMFGFAQLSDLGGRFVGRRRSRYEEFCATSPEPATEVNPVVMGRGVAGFEGLEKCNGSIFHSHKRIP
jgi:hypothetical protein